VRVGITELLVILAIVLLMFGSKKLPELADGMGKAIRNFKRGIQDDADDDVTPAPAEKQVTPRSSAATDVTPQANPATTEPRPVTPVERKP
jgi:sec-independent protein translocase protein TatA